MVKKKIDTIGRICPYPIIATVREMDNLKKNDELEILFDDPLALKSIPDEVESYNVDINHEKKKDHWKMSIKKR